jgi:hypothetical protein
MNWSIAARDEVSGMAHTGKINEQSFLERLRRLPKDKIKKVEGFVEHLSEHQGYSVRRLEADYKEMAADETREQEALAWIETDVGDALDELPKEKRENWR